MIADFSLCKDINILAGQTNKCALLCFGGIRMSDEPLVASPEKLVFKVLHFNLRCIGVGVLRKNNCYTEGSALACATRSIVQGGCIELYSNTSRATECFYLGGIQLAVNDILLSCKKEDNFVCRDVDLAVSVVLNTVQQGVGTVTETNLSMNTVTRRCLPW